MYRLRVVLASAPLPPPTQIKNWGCKPQIWWLVSWFCCVPLWNFNELWLLHNISARKIFKFIDHRGLSFYEYCLFCAVWNKSERILITLLKRPKAFENWS